MGVRAPLPRPTSGWPLLPLAPAIVVVVGIAVATAIGVVGVDSLRRASDERTSAFADVVCASLAARLEKTPASPAEQRLEVMRVASRRTGTELLLVSSQGDVLLDASLGPPDKATLKQLLERVSGETTSRLGVVRFASRDVRAPDLVRESPKLVAFVAKPNAPASAFLTALIALTTLLVGVAAAVAHAVVRDASRDIRLLTERVREMAEVPTEPTGETVPVRSLDEVGVLTVAFNDLVARFAAAEKAYREDLERAENADRDRATFLAAVSHELRSPLNAILGFADVLAAEVDGPLTPDAKEEVEQIRGAGQHLLGLINDILEYSALESGQLRLTRSDSDLVAIASEVVRESRAVAHDKPVAVEMYGEPDLVAYVDPRRIRQVLWNLVGNAVKFTQRGRVQVEVRRDGAHARISVSDTGPGISPEERAVIFEDYKQAAPERRKRRGTGLGLAIARRLVALHQGTITVESAVGQGSTFHVRLPIARPSKDAKA